MSRLNFYDRFEVELRGQAPVIANLRKTYEHFVDRGEAASPDLVVEATTTGPEPDAVHGGTNAYFGRAGDRFVIQEGRANFLDIDADWSHVRTSPNNIHHHIAYIIEFELRKQLAPEGKAMLHASGVRTDGETLLFPAWRHAGKTNTLMTFLADGADYLSDDRVWVDGDGTVLGYPIPINVMGWNDEMFEVDPDLTRTERLRRDVSDYVLDRVDMERSIVDKMIYFFTDQFVSPDVTFRLMSVDEIVPTADFVAESTIDRLMLLRATLDAPDNRVDVEDVPGDEALTDLNMISYYEWNRRLIEYFGTFDMLFPSGDRLAELEAVIDAEERIFADLVGSVDTYRAHVPRERDWIETGIAEEIREKLPSASRQAEAEPSTPR